MATSIDSRRSTRLQLGRSGAGKGAAVEKQSRRDFGVAPDRVLPARHAMHVWQPVGDALVAIDTGGFAVG